MGIQEAMRVVVLKELTEYIHYEKRGAPSGGLRSELRVCVSRSALRTPLISVRDQTANSYRYHSDRRYDLHRRPCWVETSWKRNEPNISIFFFFFTLNYL